LVIAALAQVIIIILLLFNAEICSHSTWKVTKLSNGAQASGLGETVLRDYMLSMGYKQEGYEADPRFREVADQNHLQVIDRNKYYKTYHLIHTIPDYTHGHLLGNYNESYTLHFVFEEGVDTSEFETLLGSYAAMNDVYLETY
jgi:hypothetical protein